MEEDHVYLPRDPHDTQLLAAEKFAPKAGTLRAMVYEAIAAAPCTDDELYELLGKGPNSVRPRRVELVEGRYIEDSGRRRTNRWGNPCIVWQVVKWL